MASVQCRTGISLFLHQPNQEGIFGKTSTPAFSPFTHAFGSAIAALTMRTSWRELCLLQDNDTFCLEDEVHQFVIGNGRESGIELTFLPVLF